LKGYLTDDCLGFNQDRVNFHQKPGGDTAGLADTKWPNRAGYSIPYDIMLGSDWGSWRRGKLIMVQEWAGR